MQIPHQIRERWMNIVTVLGIVTLGMMVIVTVGAQELGQTTHQSSPPQITTSGQTNWPLHNLDIGGSRYADIDEINTSNASRLALAWSFTAGAANSITQVPPLVVDGVMYLNAGSTVFALNAVTGESVWTMKMDDS